MTPERDGAGGTGQPSIPRHLYIVADEAVAHASAMIAIEQAATAIEAHRTGTITTGEILGALVHAGILASRAHQVGWPFLSEVAA